VCVCSDTDSLDQFIVDTDMVSASAEYGIPPSREGRRPGQGGGGGGGGGGLDAACALVPHHVNPHPPPPQGSLRRGAHSPLGVLCYFGSTSPAELVTTRTHNCLPFALVWMEGVVPPRVLMMGREGERLPRTAARGDRLPGSPPKRRYAHVDMSQPHTAPRRLWYQQSMVTRLAASLPTGNCPQPKEA
jgi:hypothetical protein